MNRLQQLHEAGVSIWLDTIRRNLLTTGSFARMIADDAVTGVTSNPTIFEKAISGSTDYDVAVRDLLAKGVEDPVELFFALALEDIRLAADALRPVFDASDGRDGFASFEVTPDLARDTAGTVEQARTLFARLDRPNVMIKVPGTEEGIPAIEELTASGVNVNVTLLFSVPRYLQAAGAYIAGLERRVAEGLPVAGMASVASFFVSRVDTAADRLLPEASSLRGSIAIANARRAYREFRSLFSGPRWDRLAAAGARVQRPLWASTGTKDPAYSDVMYVEELIAPETINTMPEATLVAFRDHGRVAPTIESHLDDAEHVIGAAAEHGIDLDRLTADLLEQGVEAFAESYRNVERVIEDKADAVRRGRHRRRPDVPALRGPFERTLRELQTEDVVPRIWRKDFTVWAKEPREITDRLGWLNVADLMAERLVELNDFAERCAADGLDTAVLAGMGGSSLAPEVIRDMLGVAPGMLRLEVLDTTSPDEILALERRINVGRTLFLIASKSGTTTETLSHLAYFWSKIPDGSRFVAITDPDTPLDALARERGFRATFRNPPDIGGRYSALSYVGLVPAALMGVDSAGVLDRAVEMTHACASCVPPDENPGAWLGALMGTAARAGRDKLTLALAPPWRSFGYWVEQLIAESTGKAGTGIVPVEGEDLGSPDVYGEDRLFVGVGGAAIAEALEPLERAGHPSVVLDAEEVAEVGGEFFRWELATAVAGHVLGIHPFDQPNVQEAKDATKRLLQYGTAHDEADPAGSLAALLESVRPGDYLGLQAYVARTPEVAARLHRVRMRLRDRLRVATTVGFGPRFLHSTGQLHKGGPDTGVFIQVVEPPASDVPIPGERYSFGDLFAAQSAGDLESLRAHGRRVVRVTWQDLESL